MMTMNIQTIIKAQLLSL